MIEHTLWVEKYRPAKISDCVLTQNVKTAAEGFVAKGNMPSLLLCGPAGSGKTTLAKALCAEFGYDSILINASNERGIDVLRSTITQFGSSVSLNSDTKVIIMDEFDMAAPLLQTAMRAAIEEFSRTTRFIFTCNYPQKIIQPIHSRCSVLDFTVKSSEKAAIGLELFKRISYVLDSESVSYDKRVVQELILKFFPDFRRIINELQRYAAVSGNIDSGIISALDTLDVNDFVNSLKTKNFKNAKRWIVENLALSDQQTIYRQIYDNLFEILSPHSIPQAILLIANYQYRGITAADPEVQMAAFAIEMMSSDLEFK